MTTDILCEVHNRLCTLTLNRPAKLNALKASMFREIDAHLASLDLASIDCLLITGAGRSFCAGHDLGDLATGAEAGAVERMESWSSGWRACRCRWSPQCAAIA